jgi:hypothetical protein
VIPLSARKCNCYSLKQDLDPVFCQISLRLVFAASHASPYSIEKGHIYWYVNLFWHLFRARLFKIMLDHRHYAHARLLASTEASIRYRTFVWYITLIGLLFVPTILVAFVPLVFGTELASVFNVADARTISAALTMLLAYVFLLTLLYGMFQCRIKCGN